MGSFKQVYDQIAERKGEAHSPIHYGGGNGRVDRAAEVIKLWIGLGEFQSAPSLLDIGGATGNLGYLLRDVLSDRAVIDIAEACRGPAEEKGNRFICANIDELNAVSPVGDSSVDIVAMLDVIEHVIDPIGLARECARVLRPGGRVLVNTPNIQFWRHIHSLAVEGVFPHTSGDPEVYHGGHVAFYNMNDLTRIFGSPFIGHEMVTFGLTADPPPPIWLNISSYPDKLRQLSYSDLVFTCRKS